MEYFLGSERFKIWIVLQMRFLFSASQVQFFNDTSENFTSFEVNRQWKIDARSSINYHTWEPDSGRPFIDVTYVIKEKNFMC